MSDAPRKRGSSSTQPDNLAGSDFLFHLYRGAELLQENDVHGAKSEIENAMRLQPREPQGQDLLAQVYFRLGLYPRSIAIYESLADTYPEEVTPRINLALCYLKTGQPERARAQLERVVSTEPQRQRAWGYLGLAFERLGDYEKACASFERAGYESMARRMRSVVDERRPRTEAAPDARAQELSDEVRSVAEAAFHELDAADDAFSLALPSEESALSESGSWFAVELGQSAAAIRSALASKVQAPRSPRPEPATPEPPPAEPEGRGDAVRHQPASVPSANPVEAFARASTLVFPRVGRAARHVGGAVLVTLKGDFAVRLDLVQAMTTASRLSAEQVLMRNGTEGEPLALGGSTRPLVLVEGARSLVLRAAVDRSVHAVELQGQDLYVRESCLGGFDAAVGYENGRLASGHGDTIALVHLRGSGLAALDLPASFAAVEVNESAGCVLRCQAMLGWIGRVIARCLPAADAPGQGRGWAAFSGEGTVLFDPTHELSF